jgi:hypothetical protein
LLLAGLLGLAGQGAADDLAAYRVTDPNASFFAVDQRLSAVTPASQTAAPCPEDSLARPIDHFVTIPAFYQDREGWRRASRPFFAFEAQATGFAEAYVRTGAPVHARCLVALLSFWAERRALTTATTARPGTPSSGRPPPPASPIRSCGRSRP